MVVHFLIFATRLSRLLAMNTARWLAGCVCVWKKADTEEYQPPGNPFPNPTQTQRQLLAARTWVHSLFLRARTGIPSLMTLSFFEIPFELA